MIFFFLNCPKSRTILCNSNFPSGKKLSFSTKCFSNFLINFNEIKTPSGRLEIHLHSVRVCYHAVHLRRAGLSWAYEIHVWPRVPHSSGSDQGTHLTRSTRPQCISKASMGLVVPQKQMQTDEAVRPVQTTALDVDQSPGMCYMHWAHRYLLLFPVARKDESGTQWMEVELALKPLHK